ncbi:DUF4166 domain-containing protein [Sphingomonas canadensis]|uniref:DUF4166 domain-containing protein n=1 Tax=Sphingomonas canadensis TaxID=1219257 RepID=A0ABW3H918_9SPHN|nr:DUF4166 domain-containing protein [Sphingomonas canadensis]MCW3837048.1 DUF4166 domain-containing protein [Sphingomonas canadensis]
MGAQATGWQGEWWSEPVRRRCRSWHRPAVRTDGDAPFRRLLGDTRWALLPPAVRRRFARHVAAGACVTYAGQVTECRMRGAGWLLAQACRLIGAPLPLGTDTGVAASVTVTGAEDGKGQYWMRQYGRAHGFPQVIHSCKRFAGPTGLEEYLGLGIGIALRLDAADGSLLFLGDHYFLQLGRWRLRLPRWLEPGRLVIGHVDLGAGRFAFTLDLIHPWLGELVHQLAVFEDEEGER